jgi:hypothetical protein
MKISIRYKRDNIRSRRYENYVNFEREKWSDFFGRKEIGMD